MAATEAGRLSPECRRINGGIIVRFLQALVSEGLGPVRASDAPALYRVLLGALVVSLVLSAIRAARSRDLAQLGSLVLQVPALYGVWLAYGQGIGIAALAMPPLVWSWVTRLPGTEWNIPARLLLLLLGPYSPLERVTRNSGAKRLRHALFDGSAIYALGTVGVAHALPSPYLTIVVIFALGISAEGIFANILGARGDLAGLLVAPVLLVAGVLGAADVFAVLTRNPTLDGIVWIQATAACAAYAFVQSLVLRTERGLGEQISGRSPLAKVGEHVAHLLGKSTDEDLARDIMRGLDATSHQVSGLSALAFLLTTLGIHFVLSDALALTAAIARAVPLLGALIAGVALATRRQMLNVVLSKPISAVLRRGGGFSAADSMLGHPMFRGLLSARSALLSAVGWTFGGYATASILLGLAPQSQVDGETVLDFIDGSGVDTLLRSAQGAASLLVNGMFWLEALRTLTSIALVLGAVGALRFVAVVQEARRRYGSPSAGGPATTAAGEAAR